MSCLFRKDLNDQNVSKGIEGFKRVQNGSKGCKRVQKGAKGFKRDRRVQKGAKGFKRNQNNLWIVRECSSITSASFSQILHPLPLRHYMTTLCELLT